MTTRITTRPQEHIERGTILTFAQGIDVTKIEQGTALDLTKYMASADAYNAARNANQVAWSVAAGCTAVVRTASKSFADAFNRWTVSIDDANGKGFAEPALKIHLGNRSGSQFLASRQATRVDLATTLFAFLPGAPALTGDPEKLDALKVATVSFSAALSNREAALRARTVTSTALLAATKLHDSRWGDLVDALRDTDPALASQIPTFHRISETPDPAAPSPEPPAPEPPADAETEPPTT